MKRANICLLCAEIVKFGANFNTFETILETNWGGGQENILGEKCPPCPPVAPPLVGDLFLQHLVQKDEGVVLYRFDN